MNITDMRLAVMLGLDKTSALASPAFEDEEIDYWLNEAQLELVKRKVFGNNARQEGINDSVKRMDDLNPLITNDDTLSGFTTHYNYNNVKYRTLPSNYMFYVGGSVRFTDGKSLEAKLVRADQINNLVQTEYNIPCLRSTYVYISEGRINYIYDPYLPFAGARLTYIRKPLTLASTSVAGTSTSTCELPLQVHPEVVALTVTMLLENIESERFQTNQLMYNNKE